MFRPIKLKSISTGVVAGGGELDPPTLESRAKLSPSSAVIDYYTSTGTEIELLISDTNQLWRFLANNEYTDLTLEEGNRVALSNVEVEYWAGSKSWVITGKAWQIEPYYVRLPRSSFLSERVTTGFQADVTPIGAPPPSTTDPNPGGAYVLVAKMGNNGVSSGKHWHLDEFASTSDRGWGKQIAPRGVPGKPSDIPFKVGSTPDPVNLYQFGQAPDTRVTSGYGLRYHPVKRRRSLHSGVDVVNNTNCYLFAPATGWRAQTGVAGYGTYIWCGRFGIGHSDLKGSSVTNSGQRLAHASFKTPVTSDLAFVTPSDNYGLEDRLV